MLGPQPTASLAWLCVCGGGVCGCSRETRGQQPAPQLYIGSELPHPEWGLPSLGGWGPWLSSRCFDRRAGFWPQSQVATCKAMAPTPEEVLGREAGVNLGTEASHQGPCSQLLPAWPLPEARASCPPPWLGQASVRADSAPVGSPISPTDTPRQQWWPREGGVPDRAAPRSSKSKMLT